MCDLRKNLAIGLLLASSIGVTHAQWVAFNDHYQGRGSSNNTTFWNVYTNKDGAPGISGALKNITNGTTATVGVTLTITNQNLPPGVSQTASPATSTPAYVAFNSWVDWGVGSNYWNSIVLNTNSVVAHVFTGLRTDRLYSLKATAMRGAGLTTSWVLGRLVGASQFRRAHSANVQTITQVPTLATNEAILNSGANNNTGDLFDWEDILPANGTLVLYSYKYSGTVLNGSSAYSNAFAPVAIRLEQRPATVLTVTSQPRDATVCSGGPISFSVAVSGTPPYYYQWRKVILGVSTNLLGGETNSTYNIDSSGAGDQASYQVIITNSISSVTSRLASLVIQATPVVITNEPDNLVVAIGDPATFALDVTNNAAKPISYRWYQNSVSNSLTGSLIPLATNASYTINAVSTTNLPYYYATASNCLSMDTSRVASLSIFYQALTIINQPDTATVLEGGTATLTVVVDGSVPRYLWHKQGVGPLTSQTNATLTITNARFIDSGYYYVVVTNPVSQVTSILTPVNGIIVVNQKPFDIVQLKTTGGTSNAIWKYNQQGVDLGTAWRATNYNDGAAGWASGRGGLMVEDNGAITPWRQTTLSLTAPNGNRIWTYYFRTSFTLTNDPRTLTIYTTNIFDDGMIVYLNGKEIYRYNMPSGDVGYSTAALNLPAEGVIYLTNLPNSLLVQGTNYLAVEAHQVATNSSDIVMCLGAQVVFTPPTAIQITTQPPNTTVEETHTATIPVVHLGAPAYYQWYKLSNNVPVLIPWATSQSLSITNVLDGSDDGYYFVTVSNILGLVTSSNAYLTVIPDTNAPVIVDADGTASPSTIKLTFNENLMAYYASRPAAAPTNILNYSVTNTSSAEVLNVTSAVFTNGNQVILTTAGSRSFGYNYVVTIGTNGVVDMSPRHNLAINIAAPVATIQNLINVSDFFDWDQPLSFSYTNFYYTGAWRSNNFDPYNQALYPGSSWGPGAGGFANDFGVNSGGLEVPFPVSGQLSQTDGYLATYFRRGLSYNASPLGLTNRQMRYFAQSGAILYLNGQELIRYNMPDGTPTVWTAASAQVQVQNWSAPMPLPESLLLRGTNVLAAELHITAPTDYYAAFAVEMSARADSLVVGRAVITSHPRSLTVYEGDPAVFTLDGAGGQAFQWRTNAAGRTPVNDPSGTNTSYTIPRVQLSQDGMQISVVMTGTGSGNSVTSSNATVRVLTDTNPPVLVGAYLTSSNIITATFSEPVTVASATSLLHYSITNGSGPNLVITSISLTNGSNALIRFATFNPGDLVLVATEIRDASLAGNYLATNSRVTVGLKQWPLSTFDVTAPEGLWRYNQSDIDLGTAWRQPAYSDQTAGWTAGHSVFDWKNPASGGPRATVDGWAVGTQLSGLGGDGNTIPTIYFRKQVYVPLMASQATLTLRHLIDDGAVWYVNGTLLDYFNMDLPTYFTAYSASAIDAVTMGPYSYDGSTLVAGTNLVAVEVHNASATSSDITFGSELMLDVPSVILSAGGPTNAAPAPTPVQLKITRQTTNVVLSWTNNGAWILQRKPVVTPDSNWVAVPSQTNPYTNAMGTNKQYFYRLFY